MMTIIKERCIYCGADLIYDGTEEMLKCEACGNTIMLTQFQSEQLKIRQAMESGEQAKKDLEQAVKERQEAQDRLNSTVGALLDIRASQNSEEETLNRITGMLKEDAEAGKALKELVEGLSERQGQDTDVLRTLLYTLMENQSGAGAKLDVLRGIADRILTTQDQTIAKLQMQTEIVNLLQNLHMEEQAQQRLIGDFYNWSFSIHEEDLKRLEEVRGASDILLAGQKKLDRKVDQLQKTAEKTQATLEEFHGQWQAAQLNELVSLYHQAENYQRDRNYEKADEFYHQVITKGGADAEVYWRLVLCHYCVEYQQDGDGTFIPIILNPDLTDPAELSVRSELDKNMDSRSGAYYRGELAKIDRILENYRMVRDQVQYDVFLSVKQNEDGHYTKDSDVAADLYDFLTDLGLRVFNSRRTVIPAGQDYEPYIISALMSAKALIVVGTTPEHMNAQWVRNEWSRFQWLQKYEKKHQGKTDRILFCYLAGNMSPYQIPKALNPNKQAIMDGVKAHEALEKSLEFLLPEPKDDEGPEEKEESLQSILVQMQLFLFGKKYSQVLKRYDQLIEQGKYLDNVRVHLYALCARKEVISAEALASRSDVDLDQEPVFSLIMNLARDAKENSMLVGLLAKNRDARKAAAAEEAAKRKREQKAGDGDKERLRREQQKKEEQNKAELERRMKENLKKREEEQKRLQEEEKKKQLEEERRRREQQQREEEERRRREQQQKEEEERRRREQQQREEEERRRREQQRKEEEARRSAGRLLSEAELADFLRQELPSVHAAARVGTAIQPKLLNQSIKLLGAQLAQGEKPVGLICLKGIFEGNAVVLMTTQRIYINVREQVFPTIVAPYLNIAGARAIPLNTNPKKNTFVLELRNGNSLAVANPSSAMKDTINFKALAIVVNDLLSLMHR